MKQITLFFISILALSSITRAQIFNRPYKTGDASYRILSNQASEPNWRIQVQPFWFHLHNLGQGGAMGFGVFGAYNPLDRLSLSLHLGLPLFFGLNYYDATHGIEAQDPKSLKRGHSLNLDAAWSIWDRVRERKTKLTLRSGLSYQQFIRVPTKTTKRLMLRGGLFRYQDLYEGPFSTEEHQGIEWANFTGNFLALGLMQRSISFAKVDVEGYGERFGGGIVDVYAQFLFAPLFKFQSAGSPEKEAIREYDGIPLTYRRSGLRLGIKYTALRPGIQGWGISMEVDARPGWIRGSRNPAYISVAFDFPVFIDK